jgi:hypothetical protein
MAVTQSIHVWRGRPADIAMLVSGNICYHFFIAKARRTALPPIPPQAVRRALAVFISGGEK